MIRERGFTLVEIAVVLVIASLMLSMGLRLLSVTQQTSKRIGTNDRLAAIEATLALYASQVQRLPCPADGSLQSTDLTAGMEQRNLVTGDCMANQMNGVVPWRTLSIPEADATDGYFNRFSYRVAPGLTRTAALNMTACDPGGGGAADMTTTSRCLPTCSAATMGACTSSQAAIAGRGIEVRTTGGVLVAAPAAVPSSGAAFVLISHGESAAGARNGDGIVQAGVARVGTGEAQNRNDQALVGFYVQDVANFDDSAAHFDDMVRAPSILTLTTKAGLAPRPHI